MKPYMDLVRSVLAEGEWVEQRAALSDGTRPRCLSLLGTQSRYDLRKEFPLLGLKRVPFRHVAEELFWFLSGSTNVRELQAKGVTIWDEWAAADGDLGPIYGKQWRSWEDTFGGIDQIQRLILDIGTARDEPGCSGARRMILSAWNVAAVDSMALPPCHVLSQWHVRNGLLSCNMYQRSADVFLGVPFNVASYALLVHLLAHVTGLRPGWLIHSIGDAHVYENHMPGVEELLIRDGRGGPPLPTLTVEGPRDIDEIRYEHLRLSGYEPLPLIPGEVAV